MFAWSITAVTAASSARAATIRNEASERRKSCETRSRSRASATMPSARRAYRYAFGLPDDAVIVALGLTTGFLGYDVEMLF